MADNKVTVMRLTKDFGNNNRGEIASFSAETAAHILKHEGGERLGEVGPGERYDVDAKKVVRIGEPAAAAKK